MTEPVKIVLETNVLAVNTLIGPQKREYREVTVSYPGFSFCPGQFVMIKKNIGPSCWAYPYMIQREREDSFTVYAAKGTSLFDACPGLPVVVWGPSGKTVSVDRDAVVVTEPAAAFLATPFLNRNPSCKFIALTSRENAGLMSGYANGSYVESVDEAGALLREMKASTVIGALNMDTVRALVAAGVSGRSVMAFASTKISCGVDGCKSCYLHSPELPLGLSVCCNGPYLPYDKIDFEANIRCFHAFE